LASAGRDGLVRIWDAGTGAELRHFSGHRMYAYSVAFSPDGKLVASGDRENIHLWDLTTGKELWKVRAYDNGQDFKKPGFGGLVGIYGLVFFPDSRTLAVSECSARVSLWDVATGKSAGAIDQWQGGSDTLQFLRDGKTLVSLGGGLVRFWVN